MSMICRKSMSECRTPGMCSPFGGCQNPAQSELAALREELAVANNEIESRISAEVGAIEALQEAQQRLADAERRNAELTDLIEKAHTWVDRNNCGGWDAYELRDRLADALKPTESGASE